MRDPITDPAELDGLDDADLLEGYRDGRAGEPEPGDNRSISYWHGWRNGAADGGHRPIDAAQRELARAMVARTRAAKRSDAGVSPGRPKTPLQGRKP
jgi:hypothetical protein